MKAIKTHALLCIYYTFTCVNQMEMKMPSEGRKVTKLPYFRLILILKGGRDNDVGYMLHHIQHII